MPQNIHTGAIPTFLGVNATPATATHDILSVQGGYTGTARFTGVLRTADLTAARTWTLPNADGTIALAETIATSYQPLDTDLTVIAGLTGTEGFLKKTGANSWTLDNNTYYLDSNPAGYTTNTGTVTSIATGNGITGGTITTTGTIGLTGQALALHNLATNGLIARTGTGTVAARTITAVT